MLFAESEGRHIRNQFIRAFLIKAVHIQYIRSPAQITNRPMSKEKKKYLVTSALPYANGPLHLGHLAGAYLPADIYVRYLRLMGEDVVW
ncbi:MAG: class I tRNA ligase family protein, partial [Saprospiraceae bacterium]|nr:class I tRNA ligase family protein [Saprospiraceae bacterium]